MTLPRKRLIMCCDGTWMNSDAGGTGDTLQVPSNVTRISRSFKHLCSDGRMQIINYESGIGTGSNILDSVAGGAFGAGLSERVREAYQFLCANYCDGDEIVLIGFSRGAYTVRAVAGMVGEIGLLTREGMELFYPIFKDMEHWMDDDYDDPFPALPFSEKPKGPGASEEYKARLERMGFTRVREGRGTGKMVTIKAIGVFDTVGSLGIPDVSWLSKLKVAASEFYDTSLSPQIENAFQALALDETRPPFTPAVWHCDPGDGTVLRQVWFPGNHGNVGGGWADQNIANLTLSWMMDQLASVGVEFDEKSLHRLFDKQKHHYESLVHPKKERPFAVEEIHIPNRPFRPWGLGAIQHASNPLYALAGTRVRTPGMYRQVERRKAHAKTDFLLNTNEKIHSSVRVRLACKGLGLDDGAVWGAEALKNWKLVRSTEGSSGADEGRNGIKGNGKAREIESWGPPLEEQEDVTGAGRWVWKYVGREKDAPPVTMMEEETMGPYERYWLKLAGGAPNAYRFAGSCNHDE